MRQVLTTFLIGLVAIVWLTDFVWRILAIIWPVVAAAVLLVVISAAVSVSIALMGRGLRTLRPAPVPYEFIPYQEPGTALTTFAQVVQDAFTGGQSERDEHVRLDRWRVAVLQFCLVAGWVGFSVRDMQDYVSRSKRQVYVALLAAGPHRILLSDKEGTRYAPGWNYRGLRAALGHGVIELPYPAGDPPYVNVHLAMQHTQHTQPSTVSTARTGGAVFTSAMGG